MNKGSWNSFLASLEIDERQYVETTLDGYPTAMRTINTPLSRRPDELKGKIFKTELFTAVSNSKAGEIRYLVCVERLK